MKHHRRSKTIEIMIRAAIDGVGLAFMSEEQAAPHVAAGALVRETADSGGFSANYEYSALRH
jgi:hypothetical protein